jgi:hypothetical protein
MAGIRKARNASGLTPANELIFLARSGRKKFSKIQPVFFKVDKKALAG